MMPNLNAADTFDRAERNFREAVLATVSKLCGFREDDLIDREKRTAWCGNDRPGVRAYRSPEHFPFGAVRGILHDAPCLACAAERAAYAILPHVVTTPTLTAYDDTERTFRLSAEGQRWVASQATDAWWLFATKLATMAA